MNKKIAIMTETMFYTMMALFDGDKCGKEIYDYVKLKTNSRIIIGAGTLYTILSNFLQEELIKEINVYGRKRTYTITKKGIEYYLQEIERLKICLKDSGRY